AKYWGVSDPQLVSAREAGYDAARSFTLLVADAGGAAFEIVFLLNRRDACASLITRTMGALGDP
ncbi:MAG: hypothetical protein AB7Y46_11320, partial [Armatimonadota bacterium]